MTSALITTEKRSDLPILIIDKVGIIGVELAKNIMQESLVILVSARRLQAENVIHIPYVNRIPTIPDNTYSHIFLIDESGAISKGFITPFVKKAKHDGSDLILVLKEDFANRQFVDGFVLAHDKAKVVVTADIFAKDFIFDPDSTINKFIKQIKNFKKIEVPGDGTEIYAPVFLDDVVVGILQAGFIEDKEKVFLLIPKNKPTLLTLAGMFQKKDPNIKIDFAKTKYVQKPLSIIEGKYLLEEGYNLEDRIQKIEFERQDFEEIKRVEEKQRLFNIESSKINYLFFGVFLTAVFAILLPIISSLILSASGAYFLGRVKNNLEIGAFDKALQNAKISYSAFLLADSSFTALEREAKVVGIQEVSPFLKDKIEQGKDVSFSASSVLETMEKIKLIFLGKSQTEYKDFASVLDNIKNSLIYYQKQKELGNIPSGLDAKLNSLLDFTSSTLDTWPEVLGFKGTKSYLVLFQNNMELRPGGGFIGSFAIVNVDKGKIKQFKIYDVYDADGQLKGRVEPPFAIRRYLGSPNWYLRDSNFDIDFSKGAVSSAVFLSSELNLKVDGVIGVDLSFVKNILEQTGEINVLDYNQRVNSENLFQVTQSRAEKDFFPGSTQKKNFLNSLLNSIALKLSEDKNISYMNLLGSLMESVTQKHILFAFNNTNIEALFSVNGWGGTLFDQRSQESGRINDIFGINEANLGANKVNYFISRSIVSNIKIAENGQLSHTLKISFKNNADKSLGSQGSYKNFLRVILPSGTTLSKVEIDGEVQNLVDAITDPSVYEKKGFTAPKGLEIFKEEVGGKAVFGFLLNVAAGELKNITLSYDSRQKLDLSNNDFTYSVKTYKQPGVDSIPISISLSLPKNIGILDYPAGAVKKDNGVFVSENLTKDKTYDFRLSLQ